MPWSKPEAARRIQRSVLNPQFRLHFRRGVWGYLIGEGLIIEDLIFALVEGEVCAEPELIDDLDTHRCVTGCVTPNSEDQRVEVTIVLGRTGEMKIMSAMRKDAS